MSMPTCREWVSIVGDSGDDDSPSSLSLSSLGGLPLSPSDDHYDDFSFASHTGEGLCAVTGADPSPRSGCAAFIPSIIPANISVDASTYAAATEASPPPESDVVADENNGATPHNGRPGSAERSARMHRFAKYVPKVELHAHLNGCIRESTLLELARERGVSLSSRIHCGIGDGRGDGDGSKRSAVPSVKRRSLVDCFEIFEEIRKCVDDLGALRRIAREALEDFASCNVAYVELRSTPKRLLVRGGGGIDEDDGSGARRSTKREYVETILDVMSVFEKEERERYQQDREGGGMTGTSNLASFCRLPLIPRFLVSIDRSSSVDDAEENVSLAKQLVEEGCPFVAGVELGGNPTKNDFRHFEPALAVARKAGLKVSVHCGEVPCSSDPKNEESASLLRAAEEAEAVLRFSPDRIGHALLLPPSVVDALRRNPIPVECCPTSNVMTLELATSGHDEVGDLVEGLRQHPRLRDWLEFNYPLSVSTDDSGVFGTNPTREILLLAKAFGLDEHALGRICMRSLEHIFEPSEYARTALFESVQMRITKLFIGLGLCYLPQHN